MLLPGGMEVLAGPSARKHAGVRRMERNIRIQLPSSSGGLAFSPDDAALAVAHYNGVTLWRPGNDPSPHKLAWNGMHIQPRFSRDGKVLVTGMREPSLHAWSISDGTASPTPACRTPIGSMDWTADGRFLATSGAHSLTLLVVPASMLNPLALMPLLFAPYRELVAAVACHPRKNIVAVGYADGFVLLVRFPDGAEIVLKRPTASSIAAMRWSNCGARLAIGSEDGQGCVISLDER